MSIEPSKAAEILSRFYPERQDTQWTTVANCLEELMDGQVTSLACLVSVAFELTNKDSPASIEIIRRAQKLNNRTGQAGRLEAQILAKSALQLAIVEEGYTSLAAHTSRIGFNRELKQELITMVELSAAQTRTVISSLSRQKRAFNKLSEPVQAAPIQNILEQRDDYLDNELWRRDEIHATTLACVVGQANPWEAIQQVLGHHTLPYPYEYELIATKACLARLLENGHINLSKITGLPANLCTDDGINFPVLSCITMVQDGGQAPTYIKNLSISVEAFAEQLLLEILFFRQGKNNE